MNVVPFSFESHSVRAIVDESGEPIFVAVDVCACLDIANARDAVAGLDEDEKGVATIDTPGGPQKMAVINEPGLYSLVLRSRKPEAKAFKRWITHEVLPSLRKTGGYTVASAPAKPGRCLPPVASEYRAALAIAKLSGLKGNQAILAAAQAVRRLTGTDCLALVGATHLVAENQNRALTPTEIGQILGGLSGKRVNALLAGQGLQARSDAGAWEPTRDGAAFAVLLDTGKRHGNGAPVQQLKWTEDVVPLLRSVVQ